MMLIPHTYYLSISKRLFDFLLAYHLLITLWPLLLIISLIIKTQSKGPVIFKQKRVGKDGQKFTMYKFRTMYVGAEHHQRRHQALNQAPAPMFKVFSDPRFVGIGWLLSRIGLDELPQLVNILKGEMSFVGPRPLPVGEVKKLSDTWQFRHSVRPGVFSEWSIASDRHQGLQIWKDLDRKTLENGGLIYEIKLILRTLLRSWLVE